MTQEEKVVNVKLSLTKSGFLELQYLTDKLMGEIRGLQFQEGSRQVKEKVTDLFILDTKNSSYNMKNNFEKYLVYIKSSKEYFVTDKLFDGFYEKIENNIIDYEDASIYKMLSTTKGNRAYLNLLQFLNDYHTDDEYRSVRLKLRGKIFEDEGIKIYRVAYQTVKAIELSETINTMINSLTEEQKQYIIDYYLLKLSNNERNFLSGIDLSNDFILYFINSLNKIINQSDKKIPRVRILINMYLKLFVFSNNEILSLQEEFRKYILAEIKEEIDVNKINVDKIIDDIINNDTGRLCLNLLRNKISTLLKVSDRLIYFLYDIEYYDRSTFYTALTCNERLIFEYNRDESELTKVQSTILNKTITCWFKLLWISNNWSYSLEEKKICKYPRTTRWMFSIIDSDSFNILDIENVDKDILKDMMELLRFRMTKFNNTRSLDAIIQNTSAISPLFIEYLELYFISDLVNNIKDKKRRTNLVEFLVKYDYISEYIHHKDIIENIYDTQKKYLTLKPEDILKLNSNNTDLQKAIMRKTMKTNLKSSQYDE